MAALQHPRTPLQEAGYKLTKPRTAVLGLLENVRTPITAHEVHERLEGTIDLVSIYRTLRLLRDLGIAKEEFLNGAHRYCLASVPHHHITCRHCGRVLRLPCNHTFAIAEFRSVDHELTLTGVCASCARTVKQP